MLLQKIFFPEKIGTYYLFRKKIVGIHITSQKMYATVITAQARSFTLVNSVSVDIPVQDKNSSEKISSLLEELLKTVGSYDELVATLPSSYALFKDLRLPFISKEKIALVLHYEIEPYLPFPVSEAAFDCALTKKYPEQNYSDILVTATQKKYLREYLQLFTKANVVPSVVTVDILALYGLYSCVKSQYQLEEQGALVAFDDTTIHIMYLQKGTIKAIRSLQAETPQDPKAWESLVFTLQSFSQEYGTLEKILLVGATAAQAAQAQKDLSVPCELFNLESSLPALGFAKFPAAHLQPLNPISFAAAYPSLFTNDFTLITEEKSAKQNDLFAQQIFTTAALTTTFLLAMAIHTFVQVHKLSNTVESTKSSIVKELRKNFPTIKSNNLNEALKVAKNVVSKEESIWFSFSNQTRHSFLKYLYILSTKIERDVIGLNLKKLVFSKDSILFEGSVRSFDAVNQLEQELKDTRLFVHVPDFQKTEFSQPLTLNLQGDIA